MQTRQIVIWIVMGTIGAIFLYQQWGSVSLPGGFSGFLMVLLLLAILVAVVRVLRA